MDCLKHSCINNLLTCKLDITPAEFIVILGVSMDVMMDTGDPQQTFSAIPVKLSWLVCIAVTRVPSGDFSGYTSKHNHCQRFLNFSMHSLAFVLTQALCCHQWVSRKSVMCCCLYIYTLIDIVLMMDKFGHWVLYLKKACMMALLWVEAILH